MSEKLENLDTDIEVRSAVESSDLPNTLEVWGTGSSAHFDFSVSGDLAAESETFEPRSDEYVDGSNAVGWVTFDTHVDRFFFSGEVTEFTYLDDSDGEARLLLNGTEYTASEIVGKPVETEAGSDGTDDGTTGTASGLNHDYATPAEGSVDWHIPLNENFEGIDTDLEIRDSEQNRSNYAPKSGAKYLATDSGTRYLGDGTQWVEAPVHLGSSLSLPEEAADPSDAELGEMWYRGDTDEIRVQLASGPTTLVSGSDGS